MNEGKLWKVSLQTVLNLNTEQQRNSILLEFNPGPIEFCKIGYKKEFKKKGV